jgi:glycosyltransferase involved in cell wall biosynthesis
MKVAIAAVRPGEARGGAELLVQSLAAALGAQGHRVEIVQIPFQFEPRQTVVSQAQLWRLLSLDQDRADLVIATKFPTYYVRAHAKIVWLLHQHRPLYDCFGLPELSTFSTTDKDDLRIRDQVHDLDRRYLGECRRLLTISRTVSARLRRFNGLESEVLYHPPPDADRFTPGDHGDYVFLPTRLEVNKRPWLLAEALALTRTPVRAIIAGSGPQEARLRDRARELGVLDRLDIRGFVSPDERLALYRGALAVLYPPFDEDLGYVTLEAFLAEKPVITFQDSGGPTEFVQTGRTGVVAADPAEAAEALDAYYRDRTLALRHGRAGRDLYQATIPAWPAVCQKLLSSA